MTFSYEEWCQELQQYNRDYLVLKLMYPFFWFIATITFSKQNVGDEQISDTIRFIDLFGGIGGFRHGLEQASESFECVEYIENDENAVKSYNAIFKEEHETKDAFQIEPEQLPDFDLLAAGFPCQSFSVAGQEKGFKDTRGTLFFEIARIAEEKLPKILLLENVRGLLSNSNGTTFRKVIQTLDELGYDAQWQVLNSKYHGVPQKRRRVFIVGHLRGEPWPEVFPIKETSETNTEGKQQDKPIIDNNGKRKQVFGTVSSGANSAADDSDADFLLEPVITPDFKTKDQNKTDRVGSDEGAMFTIDGTSIHGLTDGDIVRKCTPLEYWRLQGFPDWAFERANSTDVSRTQLYQQAGNAVTVNVVKALGEKIEVYFGETEQ